MPLLDHFRPPLSRTHRWRVSRRPGRRRIARLLNAGVLPAGYYAAPFLDRDGPFEIDVAALHEFEPALPNPQEQKSLRSNLSAPTLAVAVEMAGSG